jgi:hypothetical protein
LPTLARVPSRAARLAIALVAALYGALLVVAVHARSPASWVAGDFTWWWRGARAVLDGQSPYAVVRPTGPYPFDGSFPYPLTNALAVLPFAPLGPLEAKAAFVAVSGALLAWALTRDGYARLPLLVSPAFVWCAETGQWAIVLAAVALTPSLAWIATAKPNLGLAALSYRPTWRAVWLNLATLAVCFVVLPTWVAEWWAAVGRVRTANYFVPASVWAVGGPILLVVALLRWRRPEARLLGVLSAVPHSPLFYDQLLLWLIPATFAESALLTGGAWVARFVWGHSAKVAIAAAGGPDALQRAAELEALGAALLVGALYVPCALMVLARPNAGELSAWIERAIVRARLPRWAAGRPGDAREIDRAA